jgi:hypothetical protein
LLRKPQGRLTEKGNIKMAGKTFAEQIADLKATREAKTEQMNTVA